MTEEEILFLFQEKMVEPRKRLHPELSAGEAEAYAASAVLVWLLHELKQKKVISEAGLRDILS